jgi:hypothetical protein
MKLQSSTAELFAAVDELIGTEQYAAAKQRLAELHVAYHDAGRVHLRVHLSLMRIARRERDLRRIVGEILPVMFAVPTSLVQRYLGLALPSRRGKNSW